MSFASPWAFIALLLIPIHLFFQFRSRRKTSPAIKFSSIDLLLPAGASWRRRFLHLPLFLRALAFLLLIVALARPQLGIEKIYDTSHGIAIEMVIDRSSSMGEEMILNHKKTNRLEVVKYVFEEFVTGNNEQLAGRPNDIIGLVTFARFPETLCPLTLSHETLSGFVQQIRLVNRREEDGTGIGDGIALAAARLQKADENIAVENKKNSAKDYEIKSKIIILLTDGAHNAGGLTPIEAAELARQWGIKIYTIGIGQDNNSAGIGGFFAILQRPGGNVDQKTLQEIAQKTGGIFRMASDVEGLRAIYEEIDRMEKSKIESVRHVDYAEYFSYFVLAALALLVLETLLRTTLLRKIP